MIFYFSGTGNSLYAAKTIALLQGEQLISISNAFKDEKTSYEYEVKENELLGFVFPVYAWAPPEIVLDFISKLKLSGGRPYIFSLCTCGDEEGNTSVVLHKALAKKDLQIDSAFTLIMPNNYIIGFDVDSKEREQEKLKNAEQKLQNINAILSKRQKGVLNLIPGKLAGLKTVIVNPLFNSFARSTKPFFATDKCTRCGICERVCPVHTITVLDKPLWGKSCTQCLACIHHCPVQAIQYGKGTARKGRYVHPDKS